MLRSFRLLSVGLIATVAPLLFAGTAQAGLLTAPATSCPTETLSQPFTPWGDHGSYFLAPGGDFSTNAAGWTLSGGASVVTGGDGFSLNGNPPSANSLSLPDGSSAVTPAFCVGLNSPDVRFFAINSGSSTSTLVVSATVQTSLGLWVTLPVADIAADGTWQPTAPLPIILNLLPLLSQTPAYLTFTPVGQGGSWQIDDLYVDPFNMGK